MNNNNDNDNDNDNDNNQSKVEAKAQTTQWDLPWILFGGVKEFTMVINGKKEIVPVRFRNAFSEALQPPYIESAKQKCGYVPATRVLLKSEKLRHETFEGADDKTPYTIMIEELEKQNK